MSKKSKNKANLNQQIQDMKVKKNAFIIAALFWIGTSLFIYSQDEGFSDVYSWKPFVFFIVGPTFFFILLVGAFLTIFEFSKLVQLVLN